MKFINEFKEFISKGNVFDMAVGIIIGSAFTKIVTSLVEDIITPLIGLAAGKVDFSALALTVGETKFTYGNFIQTIIDFIVIALVVFIMVKGINTMKAKLEKKKEEEEEAPAEPTEQEKLLAEIRDLLKEKN